MVNSQNRFLFRQKFKYSTENRPRFRFDFFLRWLVYRSVAYKGLIKSEKLFTRLRKDMLIKLLQLDCKKCESDSSKLNAAML